MANKSQKYITKLFPHPDTVDQLKKQLVKSRGIKITGFGMFNLKKTKGVKNGIHPYSGKRQNFPPYIKITFRPVKSLKEAIKRSNVK